MERRTFMVLVLGRSPSASAAPAGPAGGEDMADRLAVRRFSHQQERHCPSRQG